MLRSFRPLSPLLPLLPLAAFAEDRDIVRLNTGDPHEWLALANA